MRKKSLFALGAAAILVAITAPPAWPGMDVLFRVAGSGHVTLDDLVKDLEGVRVVVVGEQHNNREHHEIQLAVINALHVAGVKVAVGFEMFQEGSQPDLDSWVAGGMNEQELFRIYSEDWNINEWPLYRDIFLYTREHTLPMVGLNVPRTVVNKVARMGFTSLNDEERGKIRVASCDVDPRYLEVMARVLGRKGPGGRILSNFCQAQVVWDTAMALNALDYIEKNPDVTLVILAGNFHAWKRGIAEQIRRRSDIPTRVILPPADSGFFRYDVLTEDADYIWRLP